MQFCGNCKTIWVLFLLYQCIWICYLMEFEPTEKSGFPVSIIWFYLCILYKFNLFILEIKNKWKCFCGLHLLGRGFGWFKIHYLVQLKESWFCFQELKTLACFLFPTFCLYIALEFCLKSSGKFHLLLCNVQLYNKVVLEVLGHFKWINVLVK